MIASWQNQTTKTTTRFAANKSALFQQRRARDDKKLRFRSRSNRGSNQPSKLPIALLKPSHDQSNGSKREGDNGRRQTIARAAPPTEGGPKKPPCSREDMIEFIRSGSKPKQNWRIGTEHEKFGFNLSTGERMPYAVIDFILTELCTRYGWKPLNEKCPIVGSCMNQDGTIRSVNIIGATKDGMNVTLEPGGQFELSGAPVNTLHETLGETRAHIKQVCELAAEKGYGFSGIGFDPKHSVEEIPMMPKGRYNIMKAYMPTVGTTGLDMMFRTCTIQVNVDFENEKDMIKKFQTSLALQPLATALFANSPFKDGKDANMCSLRSDVWKDTDNDRCGTLQWAFEDDFGFEKYAEYMMDVPMYFIYRNGGYINATGLSFREFMKGELKILPGEKPTIDDWEQHLTTSFPEVRLKRYLEMRGADGGSEEMITALSAFWVGLLYDEKSLDEAWNICKNWTAEDRDWLRNDVTANGLRSTFANGTTCLELCKKAVGLADEGLKRRNLGEEKYLAPLWNIVNTGKSQADVLRERLISEWNGDATKAFKATQYKA
jgi:glutamate--cysteine ligase